MPFFGRKASKTYYKLKNELFFAILVIIDDNHSQKIEIKVIFYTYGLSNILTKRFLWD